MVVPPASAVEPPVATCTFTDNHAGGDGGALHVNGGSVVMSDGTTLTGNQAAQQAAIFLADGHVQYQLPALPAIGSTRSAGARPWSGQRRIRTRARPVCTVRSQRSRVDHSAQGCKPGYCPAATTIPIPCPAGTYCAEGSPMPTNCPAGSFSAVANITSVGSCVATDPGSSGRRQHTQAAPGTSCEPGPFACASVHPAVQGGVGRRRATTAHGFSAARARRRWPCPGGTHANQTALNVFGFLSASINASTVPRGRRAQSDRRSHTTSCLAPIPT